MANHNCFTGWYKIQTNNNAVFGMPMQLTVSLIIGMISLSIIIAYILSNTPPLKIIVTIDPPICILGVNDLSEIENYPAPQISIYVTDSDYNPIKNAEVEIIGMGDASLHYTNEQGIAIFNLIVDLEEGIISDELDISIKRSGFHSYENTIIVTRTS